MQLPPITLNDIILLSALGVIALFITAELVMHSYGQLNLNINKARIKDAAWVATILFALTVLVRIMSLV